MNGENEGNRTGWATAGTILRTRVYRSDTSAKSPAAPTRLTVRSEERKRPPPRRKTALDNGSLHISGTAS